MPGCAGSRAVLRDVQTLAPAREHRHRISHLTAVFDVALAFQRVASGVAWDVGVDVVS